MKKSDKDDKGRMCNGVRRNGAIEKLKGEGQSGGGRGERPSVVEQRENMTYESFMNAVEQESVFRSQCWLAVPINMPWCHLQAAEERARLEQSVWE